MSIVDEQHVRERLQDMLESIEVALPPDRAITGRGRRLRWQRRAGAGAALAVLVALGVGVPQLSSTGTVTPVAASPAGGQVVVDQPPLAAPAVGGVVASGSTDGERWTIKLAKENGSIAASAPGVTSTLASQAGRRPARFSAGLGGPHARLLMVVGGVRSDVTAVTVQVAGSPSLHLVPVRFMGQLWVGMVLPAKLQVTNIIAFSAAGEVGHTVPFSPDPLDGIRTIAWLAPGQPGPARSNIRLPFLVAGPGAQSHVDGPSVFRTGPWGQCVVSGEISLPATCNDVFSLAVPPGKTFITINCDGVPGDLALGDGTYAYCLAGAAPQVSRVELRLSDGAVHELQPVAVGHARYLSFLISKVNIVRWTAFDAAGHEIAAGSGKSL
jgi:hypothetical protein